MFRIMTVCTGNICRSPMAEVVLRARFAEAGLGDVVVVDSTGVSDEEAGNPIDPRARAVLAERGYAVPEHTARQVLSTDLPARDLVLPMTARHARALDRLVRAAGNDGAHVRMYRTFDPTAPRLGPDDPADLLDIEDPWFGGVEDFVTCLDQVEAGAEGVVAAVVELLAAGQGSIGQGGAGQRGAGQRGADQGAAGQRGSGPALGSSGA
ncbi:protein-tyrosine phosphatase [Sediminihabitans luteus]|uniref:protein-tyrosine-phosphatase n=1 Tax=Sediminihabitans luteus TaxID=1138585 RepID=A0A2M9CCV1_9CELL|nr:low molecular weight protein-tyrosine-phosphatase [Sediminihabitans luteus]PJJ69215.1 protein-tyrosine phosphatase [Sediminihabitans luteus]GII98891.1 hypothetical protein Slu03_12690 [Sediminihabitans luteus]